MNFEDLEHRQTWMIDYALHSMRTNEFLFEFYSNISSFQNYKFNYQELLQFRLDYIACYEEDFKNPDEALRFFSAAYEHYF
jgi:hypothetical protein